MNPEEQKDIQTPDFTGEAMKMPENSPAPLQSTERSSVVNGPLLLILTVLLVLILGGMYYWFSTLEGQSNTPSPTIERPTADENNEPESTTAEAQAGMMQTTSTSDEITAIEADIEATNLEALDAELNAIDAELEASLE